jgi:hypothetical protein
MVMNAFFKAALSRSGISSMPEGKRLWLGKDAPSDFLEQTGAPLSSIEPENLEIRFREDALVIFSGTRLRKPLLRFDFAREWNNLGYGAVLTQGTWGLAGAFKAKQGRVIASVHDVKTGELICDYIAVIDQKDSATLWVNREVGLVDGYDWSIVEQFLAHYRTHELEAVPLVDEIPYGYDGAFTMRIDCDEAIASGRALFELYKKRGVPFSMAIKTGQEIGPEDRGLMSEVIEAGGSVVGHSHTHAPNWGGGGAATLAEVRDSRRILQELGIAGVNLDYMVSPFHQNSVEAVKALRDAGVKGFVSGIICNDPEFLMARSGVVPLVDGIISHSEQCMLHGDTFHADSALQVYVRAIEQALETRTFFGFLDHPFSNYHYGWLSEEERLEVHDRFLSQWPLTARIWRANLVDAMKFLDMRSKVRVRREGSGWAVSLAKINGAENLPPVAVRLKDRIVQLTPGTEAVL